MSKKLYAVTLTFNLDREVEASSEEEAIAILRDEAGDLLIGELDEGDAVAEELEDVTEDFEEGPATKLGDELHKVLDEAEKQISRVMAIGSLLN